MIEVKTWRQPKFDNSLKFATKYTSQAEPMNFYKNIRYVNIWSCTSNDPFTVIIHQRDYKREQILKMTKLPSLIVMYGGYN